MKYNYVVYVDDIHIKIVSEEEYNRIKKENKEKKLNNKDKHTNYNNGRSGRK